MSETTTENTPWLSDDYRTPEMEMAERGAGVPAAADLSLDEINPLNANLFAENRWQDHFARLRREDPVHFNEIETAGRYWSIAKYEDVRAVDGDWHTFSSAHGITLGFRPDRPLPEGMGRISPFIAMDPPEQTEQRKTVRGISAPSNLATSSP